MIARTEKVLRRNVQSSLLVGAHVNRGVPVETQLGLAVIGLGLNEARFESGAVHAADVPALGFRVDVVGIGGIGEGPEAIAAKKIFPAIIGDPVGVLGIADPHTVVLEPAVDMVRIVIVNAYVVKLRDRQV